MKPSFSSRLHLSPFFPVFSQWRKKMRYASLLSQKQSQRERDWEKETYIYTNENNNKKKTKKKSSLSLSLFDDDVTRGWWWCGRGGERNERSDARERKSHQKSCLNLIGRHVPKGLDIYFFSTLLKKKQAKNGEKRRKTNGRQLPSLQTLQKTLLRDIYAFTSKQEARIIFVGPPKDDDAGLL